MLCLRWEAWTGNAVQRRSAGAPGRRRGADHRQVPAAEIGAASPAPPGPVGGGVRLGRRHRVLRREVRAGRGRSHRGGELLHHVQAPPGRRVPRGRVHQHAVRDHGRRPDLRRPPRAPRRGQRRDHAGRQGPARARGVQRGLRLRAGRDGELGVLRQPDAGVGPPAGRRPARGKPGPAHPGAGTAVHLARGVPDPGRLQRRPGHRRPVGRPGQPGRPQAGPRAWLASAGARRDPIGQRRTGGRRRPAAAPARGRPPGGFRALDIRALAGRLGVAHARPAAGAGPGAGSGQVAPARRIAASQGVVVTDTLTPVLTASWDQPDSFTLEGYKRNGGWQALPKALATDPDDLISALKNANLRGRGGAGFPTGVKWSFLPQGDGKPHYLVVNADESEPGTCKDVPLMMADPQVLIEGVAITAYAIRAKHAFIYVRGEVLHVVRRLRHAVEEAYAAGYLGENILGKGFDLDVIVHAGAGAYICGEESALLTSLEGFRGLPRLRPPFPAVAGLYACPTVINNVESIASVPSIVANGADWFAGLGTEKSKGYGIFSLSGHVTTPGQYEAPLGITLRELLDLAGGIRAGHQLKFWTPGGSSTPIFTAEHLDVPLDFESVGAKGSMLGTRALQIFDETTCVVRAVLRWTEFYAHESCGKCTPCREGTWWLVQILERLEHGKGTEADLATLLDLCENITGRSFCALADGATAPISSSIQHFKDEYLAHFEHGGCPLDPMASTVFATAGASA